ncbi:MAG: hypothetical protein KF795_05915 [Labilithrix sp.]|nr:hypothetical protein [Labilithrix sp.]
MNHPSRSTAAGRARFAVRGTIAKGDIMNFSRGGALTALALLVALGCGGSDAAPLAADSGTPEGETVVIDLPDGGKAESPPPPPPIEVGGTAPPEGVFVSASKGAPGNDGAQRRPLKTLADAIALAKQKKMPVIACAETYPEAVTLSDGVTMFGYFDCANLEEWKRITTRAVIESPTSPAVLVEGMSLITRFEGFEVRGPDLTSPGSADVVAQTSYAMIIRGSSNLWMDEVTLRGGKGQDGVDGVQPAPNQERNDLATRSGRSAGGQGAACVGELCFNHASTTGSAGGTSQCLIAPNGGAGGRGGDGPFFRNGFLVAAVTTAQATGRAAPKNTPTAVGGAGGASAATPTALGQDGTPGPTGNLGENGGWSVNEDGIAPGNGTAGTNGQPGQGGGGGGGGHYWYTESYGSGAVASTAPLYGLYGAGGGAGGCGGVAGTPGTGGGGSVGLFIVSSTAIKIAHSRIESGKGGRAGVGALGTPGLGGGFSGRGRYDDGGDLRPKNVYGLGGGNGGNGGAAGMSGNGSPGPSLALVYNGSRVAIDQATTGIFVGQPGDGVPATTSAGKTRPAVVGVAKQEHSF